MASDKNKKLKSYGVTIQREENDTVITSKHVVLDKLTLMINVTENSGCYLHMLESFKEQLDAMLSYHSKVSVYRTDIRFPDTDDGERANTAISNFFNTLVSSLKATPIGLKRVGYFWCAERKKGKLHYHAALMINANRFKNITTTRKKDTDEASTIVGEQLSLAAQKHSLSMREPIKATTTIHRNETDHLKKYLEVFYQCSYMAKQFTKERSVLGKSFRRNSSSRLKVNKEKPLPYNNPAVHEAKKFAPVVFKGDRWLCILKQYQAALASTEAGIKISFERKAIEKKIKKRRLKRMINKY